MMNFPSSKPLHSHRNTRKTTIKNKEGKNCPELLCWLEKSNKSWKAGITAVLPALHYLQFFFFFHETCAQCLLCFPQYLSINCVKNAAVCPPLKLPASTLQPMLRYLNITDGPSSQPQKDKMFGSLMSSVPMLSNLHAAASHLFCLPFFSTQSTHLAVHDV